MAVIPEGSLFWRWCTRKPANSLVKTSRLRTWITGTMSCGLMRPRYTYLVQMVSSVCGGNQVRSTKTSVSCLQSSMVVGVSWSGAAWVLSALGGLQFIEGTMNANMYCDILKQTMIPSLWRLGHRAVFQHENNYCLAKEAEGKGNLWSILKWKVEERKVSNIHQLCDVVMEEWKRTPVATCEALVNSMPKRVKAVLENNGGHAKYWHFGPNLDIFT